MTSFYAGIGARKTPVDILSLMTKIAGALEEKGLILRSGGAEGADSAFERGVKDPNNKEIFLPWPGFNRRNDIPAIPVTEQAYAMAALFHPAWERLSRGPQALMARNMYQVLGADLNTPSKLVICWTPGGKIVGGTGQALRGAAHFNIPVINLGNPSDLAGIQSLLWP